MVENFKKKIKEDGRNIRWFYDRYQIKNKADLTYSGLTAQLNGYASVKYEVKKAIMQYLNDI